MFEGLRKCVAVAMLFFALSHQMPAASSRPGILEGQVQILRSGGAHLADDAGSAREKEPLADCPLVVLSKDGKTEIAQTVSDSEGRFRVSLPAGDYVLNAKQHGRNRLRMAARPFTVISGQSVRVDLTVESAVAPM